jgi:hypothetical protein
MAKKDDIEAAKRELKRLERDARRGRSEMDNDPAAQEVLDDEAAAAKERLRQLREEGEAHHQRPNTGMGERPGTGMGERGHRYGGAVGRRAGGVGR